MRPLLAQELVPVRRESTMRIRPPAAASARLADGVSRIVEVMKHLVEGDEVEGFALDRKRIDVALADLRMVMPARSRLARATAACPD